MKWRLVRNEWNLKGRPWFGGVGIEEDDESGAVPALVCWFYRGDDAGAKAVEVVRLHNEEEERCRRRDSGADICDDYPLDM